MKTIIYFIISSTLLTHCNCVNAQNNAVNKTELQMLKQFYTLRGIIKFIEKDSAKWNSIQKTYCTQKLRKEAKEWYDDGHDLFTNDLGIDNESLKTLTIIKDSTKQNSYIVSYIVNFHVSPNEWEKKKVILHVVVVKDSDSYKIASVK